jgi:hypothetical protein
MIDRNRQKKEEILYSKSISCLPFEDYAAKEFIKWLGEHPEENVNTVRMRIDTYEREEDYYGNGGGWDHYLRIYKGREETTIEYLERISKEENKCIDEYLDNIKRETKRVLSELNVREDDDRLEWVTWDMTEKARKVIKNERNRYYTKFGTVFDSNEA